jgi:hypothetical protein
VRRPPGAGHGHGEQDQSDQELDAFSIRALHAPSTTGENKKNCGPDRRTELKAVKALFVKKGTIV